MERSQSHDIQNTENLLSTNQKKKIDELLDEIGYSYYHYFLLFILILVFFADGTEVLVISLILKSLEKEWLLTPFSKACLASSAFIGLMIGSFIVSKTLDQHGRKKFLLWGGVIVLIFGLLSAFSTNAYQLFFFRVLMGVGIGTQIPAATVLATETIPTYNRSIYLANMWIAFPAGELYVCIVSLYVMPEFEQDKWRTVLIFCLVPVVLCLIGSFYLLESSRFLIVYNKITEAKEIIKILASYNKIEVSEKRLQEIIKEALDNPLNNYESDYKILLSNRFFKLSVNSWFIWFISSACLYITVYMLPQVLTTINPVSTSTGSKGIVFKEIIVSNLIAVPKTLIGGFLAEIKFLGRINTILIAFVFTGIGSLLVIIDIEHIYIYGGLIKLVSGICMAVIKVYSTEAYPTKIRGLGYGTGHSFARLAGMLVPFISEGLRYPFGLLGPFYFLLLSSAFACYSTYSLPFETLGRNLDKPEMEDLIELDTYKNSRENENANGKIINSRDF